MKTKKVKEVIIQDIDKDVYGVETEGTHLFITTDGLLIHNCFPKDLGAFIGRCKELDVDCKLLEEVNDYNLRIRKNHDWHEIAGASVGGRKYDE